MYKCVYILYTYTYIQVHKALDICIYLYMYTHTKILLKSQTFSTISYVMLIKR